MRNTVPITDEEHYRERVFMPDMDPYIDPGAATYVIHRDDVAALSFLCDEVRKAILRGDVPEPDVGDEELTGAVEWWVRNRYSHLNEPGENGTI